MTLWLAEESRARTRSGMALFMVLFAVIILSMLIIALWTEFFGELRQTSRMQDDTTHFYMAEAVLAKGINKVKKLPWLERFYIKDTRDPGAFSSTAEMGEYRKAPYLLEISDVARGDGQAGAQATALTNLVDFFVKITHEKEVRRYFLRAELRAASALRPTQVVERRLARVGEDFETSEGRRELLARIATDERLVRVNRPATRILARAATQLLANGKLTVQQTAVALRRTTLQAPTESLAIWRRMVNGLARELRPRSAFARVSQDEMAREQNRNVTNVLVREAAARSRAAVTPDVMAAQLLGGFAGDQALENTILRKVRQGDRLCLAAQAPINAAAALTAYEAAFTAAQAQTATSKVETMPRCLYRMATAKVALAEALPYDLFGNDGKVQTRRSGPPSRTDVLEEAGKLFERIVTEFPGSIDAPHAFIPWAWSIMKPVPASSAAAWNAARARAYQVLERLRREYPGYHLWCEEAVTAIAGSQGTLAPPADEVVHWVESRIRPMVLFFFANAADGSYHVASASMDGRSVTPLFPSIPTTAHMKASPDGSRLVFVGGSSLASDDTAVFTARTDGTGLVRLTQGLVACDYTRYSPDGTRICFGAKKGGIRQLFWMPSDGSASPTQLTFNTDPNARNLEGSWSVGGETIVYEHQSASSSLLEIWAVKADGTNDRQLILPSAGATDAGPTLSPDGKRLAFYRTRGSSVQLFTVDLPGGVVPMAAMDPMQSGVQSAQGANVSCMMEWSADGKYLLTQPKSLGTLAVYRSDSLRSCGQLNLPGAFATAYEPAILGAFDPTDPDPANVLPCSGQ